MQKSPFIALVCALCFVSTASADAPVAQVFLQTDNLLGNPISSITAGADFQLEAFVQDIRNPAYQIPGIFSAYLNVAYDPSLASITSIAHAGQADPGIMFAPEFPILQTGDLSTAGLISASGASMEVLPNTTAEQLLFTVIVHATNSGTEAFTSSFDSQPGHEFLVDSNLIADLTQNQILFGQVTLTILPEPSSLVLSAICSFALAGWGMNRWRKNRAAGA